MKNLVRRVAQRLRTWGALVMHRIAARGRMLAARAEAGMATAEYAIVTLAAVAFAGLLLAIFRGGQVRDMLLSIITEALSR